MAGPDTAGNRVGPGTAGVAPGAMARRFKVPETVPKFAMLEVADAATEFATTARFKEAFAAAEAEAEGGL